MFICTMAKKPVKFSVVDAFTDSAFKGNPAAVCLLEEDRDDLWMQALAAEFNLSETCYLTRLSDSVSDTALSSTPARFSLRWFTPVVEVDLCGHATLAAAYTLFKSGLVNSKTVEFSTLSGILTAQKVPDDVKVASGSTIPNGGPQDSYFIELNFPADPSKEFNSADASLISNALGGAPVVEIMRTVADNLLVVLPSGKTVADLLPQIDAMEKCPGGGVIVTGVAPPESGFDFISRCFYPKNGINEVRMLPGVFLVWPDIIDLEPNDPVTGSAHCGLASYWCKKLGKCDVVAYQASPRGGTLNIHLDEKNQRVLLQGKAVTVMEGTVLV